MRQRTIRFTKMEGAGNDFVVIDNRRYGFAPPELEELARRTCPRRTGIGADGLLALEEATDADYRMRYVNRDGSMATMCGNGARCLARFARIQGIGQERLSFASDAGRYEVCAPDDLDADVRLFVPTPREFATDIELADDDAQQTGVGPLHYVWPGVEHVVCFVEDVAQAPVEQVGRAIRRDDALAPAGANVNFVEGREDGALEIRTYEKGVEAETSACGTGALAGAYVAYRLQRVSQLPVTVHMPGGTLRVGGQWQNGELAHVYLEGPARVVFTGQIDVAL